MMPEMVPQDDMAPELKIKPMYIGLVAMLIVFSGIILAWLGGQGIIPIDPGLTLGLTILIATIIVCCASSILLASVASRMPEYAEMEIRFDEGMTHFDHENWENALLIFTELAGPKMDHKRALFYSALCYDRLEDWENVKKYITAYLNIKPRDREAWELLADVHRKLFEYEEAETALKKASSLPESN